jgi:hypothetical protein
MYQISVSQGGNMAVRKRKKAAGKKRTAKRKTAKRKSSKKRTVKRKTAAKKTTRRKKKKSHSKNCGVCSDHHAEQTVQQQE